MKANRKLLQMRYDDDAVSPVIAVILMVAITVVLAATVFVLVSDIGGNKAGAAPAFNLQPDEGADKLTLESAAQNADWNRLTVQIDSCAVGTGGTPAIQVAIGGATAAANHVSAAGRTAAATIEASGTPCSTTLPTGALIVRAAPAAQKMVAGDYLQFCGVSAVNTAAAGTTLLSNAKVVIKDTTANTIAYTHTFTDIADCT